MEFEFLPGSKNQENYVNRTSILKIHPNSSPSKGLEKRKVRSSRHDREVFAVAQVSINIGLICVSVKFSNTVFWFFNFLVFHQLDQCLTDNRHAGYLMAESIHVLSTSRP